MYTTALQNRVKFHTAYFKFMEWLGSIFDFFFQASLNSILIWIFYFFYWDRKYSSWFHYKSAPSSGQSNQKQTKDPAENRPWVCSDPFKLAVIGKLCTTISPERVTQAGISLEIVWNIWLETWTDLFYLIYLHKTFLATFIKNKLKQKKNI